MPCKIGATQRPGLHTDAGRQRMWNTMRQLRRFTNGDLIAASETTEANARRYVKALTAAGYVRQETPRIYGRAPGGFANWLLVKDTGPLAPRATSAGLCDFNLVDPYTLPPSASVKRHAHALVKLLREMMDRVAQHGELRADDALCLRATELVRKIDESRDG